MESWLKICWKDVIGLLILMLVTNNFYKFTHCNATFCIFCCSQVCVQSEREKSVQTRLSIEHVRSDEVCCRTLKKL